MNESQSNKWASRKLWLVVLTTVTTTVLLWFGKIDQQCYQSLVYLLVGGYLTGNTVQNIMTKEKVA